MVTKKLRRSSNLIDWMGVYFDESLVTKSGIDLDVGSYLNLRHQI